MIAARLMALGVLTAATFSVQAQTAAVSLSEESAQIKYSMLVGGQDFGRSEMSAGFLFNEDNDYVAELGLLVVDEAGSRARGLKAGLGGKMYGATVPGSNNLFALGVGGVLRYTLSRFDRVTLGVDGFYAPPIVSFIDAERFWELGARVEFAVLPQASAYLEYHEFHATIDGDSGSIDEGIRLGVQVEF